MRAIHDDAAAATAFSIKAQSPERERQIADLMGADTDHDELLLEEGVLGHEINVPLEEDAYCAASWEWGSDSDLDPHSPEDPGELPFAALTAVV